MAKIVLITGASSGMGRATARYLAARGYKVYALSRSVSKLSDIATKHLIPVEIDLKEYASIEKAVFRIVKEEKRVDILINNAGYGVVSALEYATEEQVREQFDINVFALMRMCKAVIPSMRRNNYGVIINISSFLGKVGLPLLTLYNASKYAVEGITDSLRYELREFNIRIHSVMPGFFDTEFARTNLVTNEATFQKESAYASLTQTLAPTIIEQINNGNDALEVARLILRIIEDENFQARTTVGDKSKKFIPMRKELSDEDFERRVREYYGI